MTLTPIASGSGANVALLSTSYGNILIDDAVNIDEENRKAFEAAARESELQIVAARLDDGELRIETEGVAA